jgi:hypothetical protein
LFAQHSAEQRWQASPAATSDSSGIATFAIGNNPGTASFINEEIPMTNPNTETTDNTKKDPDDWVSGDEPMTGAQASYLKTLTEQAHAPEMFGEGLSKAEASKRIDELKKRLAA